MRFVEHWPLSIVPALSLLLLASTAWANGTGRWELISYAPGNGVAKQVALWLTGDGKLANPAPQSPWDGAATPLLSIQCLGAERVAFVNLNWEANVALASVTTRLDDGPSRAARWRLDLPGGVAILPLDKEAFVSELLGKRSLRLTLRFAGATPTTTTFQVAGLDLALAPLRDQCGWR